MQTTQVKLDKLRFKLNKRTTYKLLSPPAPALPAIGVQSSGLWSKKGLDKGLGRTFMGHGHRRGGAEGPTAWMQQAQELTLLAKRTNPRGSLAACHAALKLLPGVER
jgi:hypothetical protein